MWVKSSGTQLLIHASPVNSSCLLFYLENEGCETPEKLFISSIWYSFYFPQHRTRHVQLAGQKCCNLLFLKLLPQCHIPQLYNAKYAGACRSGWLFPLYRESLLGSCQPVHVQLQECTNCLKRILTLHFTALSVDPSSTIWGCSRYCIEGCCQLKSVK